MSAPASLNPYGYVHGNPVRYSDPSGECPFICGALIFLAVAAISGAGVYGTYDAMVVHGKGGWENVESGAVFHSSHYADIQDSLLRSTGRGAGDGFLFGLSFVVGFGATGSVAKGALTVRQAWAITTGVDIVGGTAVDHLVYGDPLGEALAYNTAGTLVPEVIGYGLGRAARAGLRNLNIDVSTFQQRALNALLTETQWNVRTIHSNPADYVRYGQFTKDEFDALRRIIREERVNLTVAGSFAATPTELLHRARLQMQAGHPNANQYLEGLSPELRWRVAGDLEKWPGGPSYGDLEFYGRDPRLGDLEWQTSFEERIHAEIPSLMGSNGQPIRFDWNYIDKGPSYTVYPWKRGNIPPGILIRADRWYGRIPAPWGQ